MLYKTSIFYCFLLLFCACFNEEKTANTINLQNTAGIEIQQMIYETNIISQEGIDDDWYENIPANKRALIINDIIEKILTGKLAAYSNELGEPSNRENDQLSIEAFNEILSDTIETTAINKDTGEEEWVKYGLNKDNFYQRIPRITFIEKWNYDTANTHLSKEVQGMAFCESVFNSDNELIGFRRLFWVWFNPVNPVL